ncbi:MAG TPA: MFS transporter [Verrucomicrobiae bacterium]|nr:MFS transporter [Verrucomicrobiae bacterium]
MRAVLANARFRRLWVSAMGVALGDAFMQMGLLELFRSHHYDERVETAKMLLAVALPGFLLGPFAMAYLDRWQRRNVLIVSDALRALVVVMIASWLLPLVTGRLEQEHLFVVYALIFLIGVLTTFYYPARSALVPNLVATDDLVPANTLFAASLAVATVGGRALGGFVAEVMGLEWAVMANAFAYIASVIVIWGLHVEPHADSLAAGGKANAGWHDLKTGLVYLVQHRLALPLVILSALFAFLLGVLVVIFVGFAMNTLQLGTGGLGYLLGAGGVGAALGIAAFGRGKPWTRASWLPFVQLVVGGVVMLLMSRCRNVWLTVPLVVVLGSVSATILIHIDAKLQEQVADQRRGAVFAARGMLTSLAMIVAFWLQIETKIFRDTAPPTVLYWLGIGSVGATVLMALLMLSRRRQPGTA